MLLRMAFFRSFSRLHIHRTCVPHPLYLLLCRWMQRLSLVLAVVTTAALNIGLHVFFF